MGGSHSFSLMQEACQLWKWCLRREITIKCLPGQGVALDQHLSGMETSSRSFQFGSANYRWMDPLDLFVRRLNNQLTKYVSWKPDFVMRFHLNLYRNDGCYVFPPFALIRKCIQKVHQQRSTIALVACTSLVPSS